MNNDVLREKFKNYRSNSFYFFEQYIDILSTFISSFGLTYDETGVIDFRKLKDSTLIM